MITIRQLIKPLNPIDVDFKTRQPRKPFSSKERIEIILISLRKYQFKQSIYYCLNFLKFLFLEVLKIFYFPIIILLKVFGYSFVKINYWQFGTLAQHSFLLYMDLALKNVNKNKIFIYLPKKHVCNHGLFKIIKNNFKVIDNIFLCGVLLPFFESNLLRKDILEYDEHYKNTKSRIIYNEFHNNNLKDLIIYRTASEEKNLHNFLLKNLIFHRTKSI